MVTPLPHSPSLFAPIIPSGALLGDRYCILRMLGQGGFGRSYLAKDTQRFDETCVLKEFAPQVQGTAGLEKAQRLFEREAGVLYRLDHPQIPKFRELRRLPFGGYDYLFLVQDYIEGRTYQTWLQERQRQGQTLSEAEVALLLRQILPVLDYLHQQGMIHRDIAPDNLIQRPDGLPVLIDFGAVKQAAVTVLSQMMSPSAAQATTVHGTRLGKLGYAPPEQMQHGAVFPHSDVYALGVTALTLLSGWEPQRLMDVHTLEWTWPQTLPLNPGLGNVLYRMVALRPANRYPSAAAALQDLAQIVAVSQLKTQSSITQSSVTQSAVTQSSVTQNLIQGPVTAPPPAQTSPAPSQRPRFWLGSRSWGQIIVLAILALGTAYGILHRQNQLPNPNPAAVTLTPSLAPPSPTPIPETSPEPPPLSAEELARKQALTQARDRLNIPPSFYNQLINESFYATHPDLAGRNLSTTPEDAPLRAAWDALAAEWLDRLARLSPEQRSQLGTYSDGVLQGWIAQVNQKSLSSRALYDLVDLGFRDRFPELQSLRKPGDGHGAIDQLWRAMAKDQVVAVTQGDALATVAIDAAGNGYWRKGVEPQSGRVAIANLKAGQHLRVTLEAPPGLSLAIYPPTAQRSALQSLSGDYHWEGTLAETGLYEFVVVNGGQKRVEYALNWIVESGD